MMDSFTELQIVTGQWRDMNFPPQGNHGPTVQSAFEQLAGMMEELGELSHAFLKLSQGIRGNEDLRAQEMDAIGDLIIYLCGYCDRRNLSLADCIAKAWHEVSQRNWKENPVDGTTGQTS